MPRPPSGARPMSAACGEVEGLRGRVNLLIGLVILVLGVLLEVAFRLD